MIRDAWLAVIGVVTLSPLIAAQSAPSRASTIIAEDVFYEVPLTACETPSVVASIVVATHVAAGIEHVPGVCDGRTLPARRPDRDRVFLAGVTIADALDHLVTLDPRYKWAETDGVIVFRPVKAWSDARHFLNQPLDGFSLTDEHLGGALDAYRAALSGEPRQANNMGLWSMRTVEGDRRFSVRDGPTSPTLALDSIVRAHGAAFWDVEYCLPEYQRDYATVSLVTSEHDPTRLMIRLRPVASINGQLVDVCKSR